MGTQKQRESNIELLRILIMFLIILSHFAYHGYYWTEGDIANRIFICFCMIGGKVGVTVFILITGYFMINGKWKISKIIKIILETIFYSVVLSLIFSMLGFLELDIKNFITWITPIMHNTFWFVTSYVILYLLIPLINKALVSLSKKQYKIMIIVMLAIQYVIPRLLLVNTPLSTVGTFIIIYSIGAYLKLYPNPKWNSAKKNAIATFALYIFLIGLMMALSSREIFQVNKAAAISNTQSLVILAISICMFRCFNQIKFKQSKAINQIAKSTLGIYIIHEFTVLRYLFWKDIFKVPNDSSLLQYIVMGFGGATIVFIICLIIDQIRVNTIGKIEDKAIERIKETKLIKKIVQKE